MNVLDRSGPFLIFLGGLFLLFLIQYIIIIRRPYGGQVALIFLPPLLLIVSFSFLGLFFAVSLPGQGFFIFYNVVAIVVSIFLWLRILAIKFSKPEYGQILIRLDPHKILPDFLLLILYLLSIIWGGLSLLSPELRHLTLPAALFGLSGASYGWVLGRAPRFITSTGIHFPIGVVLWEKIISYRWLRKRGDYRNLQVNVRRPIPIFQRGVILIPEELTNEIEEILDQYLPVSST